MKRIEGRPFSASIADGSPPLAHNELLRIFIGVAQALAYAHHRGIVHQDIKPDNIMLGEFGEVLVVDWGSAVRLGPGGAPRIYGTPLYMSPEQARAEGVDARSDIYCLGATMFHALVGRLPIWSDDPDAFWARKRRGDLDEPTAAERARVPAALLAIAHKALAARPDDRYQRVDRLLQDLGSYQAGLAVSAYDEPWFSRLRRWHRRNARPLWLSVVISSVILTLCALLYGEGLTQLAVWGPRFVGLDYRADGWRERWVVFRGGFERRGEGMVSTGPEESLLMCRRQLSGATAIEYDAEIPAGSRPCDISVLWCRSWEPSASGAEDGKLEGDYLLQVGAMDGISSGIESGGRTLSFSYFKPEPGRRYHIRDEIVDDRITIRVDGRLVCESRVAIPFDGGYLALRAYFPGKVFSRVRIFERGIPERLPATALGDLLARKQRYDEAADEYRRVAEAHAGKAIGDEAIYRRGLCSFWQERYDDAFAIWRPLEGGARDQVLRLHRLDRLAAAHDPALLAEMTSLHAVAAPAIRHRIAEQWARYVDAADRQLEPEIAQPQAVRDALDAYLRVHDRLFPDDELTDRSAARLLLCCGRFHEMLRRYPRLSFECSVACLALHRPDWILRDQDPLMSWYSSALFGAARFDEIGDDNPLRPWSMFKQGRFDEIFARYPDDRNLIGFTLIAQGRLDEAIALDPDNRWVVTRALTMMGRAQEVRKNDPDLQAYAAMAMGDGERALALCPAGDRRNRWVRSLLGLQAWISGDRAAAERWFTDPPWPEWYDYWEYRQFLVPFLHGLAGDRADLERSCREAIADYRWFDEQRSYFCARALLGEIDEREFLAQPSVVFVEARWRRCQGMRAEREGRRADAISAYRAYLALPPWKRGENIDPVWDGLVRWRLGQLEVPRSP
jgi:tetratricopeptide (TPR) repeat protein